MRYHLFLFTLITLFLIPSIHSASSKSKSKSRSSSSSSSSTSSSTCLSTLSDLSNDGTSFKFDSTQKPHPSELTFCKHYRSSTCCSPSDSSSIMRQVYPLYADIESSSITFSESCRSLSVAIMCSPCDPNMGTGFRHGLCPDTCTAWYSACASDLFTTRDATIIPCTDESNVCYPLKTMVENGADMCRRMGFAVGSLSSTPSTPATSLSSLIHSELDTTLQTSITNAKTFHDWSEIDVDMIRCFDPSLPGSAVHVNSGTPTSTSSTSFKHTKKTSRESISTWEKYWRTWKRLGKRMLHDMMEHPMQLYGAIFIGLCLSVGISLWKSRRRQMAYDFSAYTRPSTDELRSLRAARFQQSLHRSAAASNTNHETQG